MSKYICTICGYIYDEDLGIPGVGIASGTKWQDIPESWKCPLCGAAKSDFKMQSDGSDNSDGKLLNRQVITSNEEQGTQLNDSQMSALCSNLSKGCEKQYLKEESELFLQLSEYYRVKAATIATDGFADLVSTINKDLADTYASAMTVAGEKPDRGALRALVWSEKVTKILNSLIVRYEKAGDSILEKTNIFVCEICGFIFVGDNPPDICPICKVPSKKLSKIERG